MKMQRILFIVRKKTSNKTMWKRMAYRCNPCNGSPQLRRSSAVGVWWSRGQTSAASSPWAVPRACRDVLRVFGSLPRWTRTARSTVGSLCSHLHRTVRNEVNTVVDLTLFGMTRPDINPQEVTYWTVILLNN